MIISDSIIAIFFILKMTWKNYFILIASIALLINILFAIAIPGHYHPDEHFQLIEFMNYKLGNVSSNTLPWEFNNQIRPWLQPWIFFWTTKGFISLTHNLNPFVIDTLLRFESLIVSFGAQILLGISLRKLVDNEFKYKLILPFIFLFFFVPILTPQPSSENWSGAMLTTAIAVLILSCKTPNGFITNNNLKIWQSRLDFHIPSIALAGFFLGLAFQFRYPSAFFIIGFAAWGFIKAKQREPFILALTTAFLFVILASITIDHWGYGQTVFVAWRYYAANILFHFADYYGTSPWYYYLNLLITNFPTPIVTFLLGLFIYTVLRFPGHLFTWCLVSYIAILCFVSHKELRFLFPILTLLILFCAMGLSSIWVDLNNQINYKANKLIFCLFSGIFIIYGLIASWVFIYKIPYLKNFHTCAWNKEMQAIRYWQTAIPARILYGHPDNHYQYDPLCRYQYAKDQCLLRMNFYDIKHAIYIPLTNHSLQQMLKTSKLIPFYLYIDTWNDPNTKIKQLPQCKVLYNNFPDPVLKLFDFAPLRNYLYNNRTQVFLECH